MRRFLKIIVLLAVFLAGYYVGHLPGSPDIFGRAADVCHRVEKTSKDISTRAEREQVSLPRAALSCLLESAADTGGPAN